MFRSLVLVLVGGSALMIGAGLGHDDHLRRAAVAEPSHDVIIDVSHRAAGDGVIALLGLAAGDRVVAINDYPEQSDRVVDVWRATLPGRYLDLTVANRAGVLRRVLVVVHP